MAAPAVHHDKMEKDVKASLKVIEACSKGVASAINSPVLPKDALKGHKGFVLLHSIKVGGVIGYEHGHGVAFKILSAAGEPPRFSAPLPIKTKKLGAGLQLGVAEIFSIILLDTPADIDMFATGDVTLGKDLEIQGYARGNTQTDVHKETTSHARVGGPDAGPRIFSVSDSYMFCDFSVNGGTVDPDWDEIKETYGEGVHAKDILNGKYHTPEYIQPVLDAVVNAFMQ